MKNLASPEIAKFRDHDADRLYQTRDHEKPLAGAFLIPARTTSAGIPRRAWLRVIASSGKDQPAGWRWDHVSVSLSDRCPTWDEMDYVKRVFFHPDEVCYQLHVATPDHISNHDYCLHIWRPLEASIPLPPAEMVGVAGLTDKAAAKPTGKLI